MVTENNTEVYGDCYSKHPSVCKVKAMNMNRCESYVGNWQSHTSNGSLVSEMIILSQRMYGHVIQLQGHIINAGINGDGECWHEMIGLVKDSLIAIQVLNKAERFIQSITGKELCQTSKNYATKFWSEITILKKYCHLYFYFILYYLKNITCIKTKSTLQYIVPQVNTKTHLNIINNMLYLCRWMHPWKLHEWWWETFLYVA